MGKPPTSQVESSFGILATFDQIGNPEKRLDAPAFYEMDAAEIFSETRLLKGQRF